MISHMKISDGHLALSLLNSDNAHFKGGSATLYDIGLAQLVSNQ